ncbi:MAG: hypothetical protein ACI845_000138 [Gammaproteobacteria bacterium]|jgi:hypothetical protein
MKNLTLLTVVLVMLSACSKISTQIDFNHEAVKPDSVELHYAKRPDCNYEIVGYLNTSGGYYSLDSLIDNFRRAAGSIGATGVYVTFTQRLDIGEFIASAQAIRCEFPVSTAF